MQESPGGWKEHGEGRAREGRAREGGENGAERVMAACSRPEGAVRGWPLGVTWVLGDPLETSPTGAVKKKDRRAEERQEDRRQSVHSSSYSSRRGEGGGCEKMQGREPVLGRFLLSMKGTQPCL